MSTTVSVDGSNFEVPENSERGWGTEVSNLLIALADASFRINGGPTPLTSEADFGTNFGLKSIYYKSGTSTPSTSGVLRLAKTDTIAWRNNNDDADIPITLSGADRIQFASSNITTAGSTDTLTNKSIDATANTLINIATTNLASGVLITDTGLAGAADTNWPSTLAVKTYVDAQIGDNDDASEITYTPTTGADWPDPDPVSVQEGLDKLAAERTLESDFTAHTGNTTNPHTVTATQVGLGNADNTSDADKPISDATQTALTGKEDSITATTSADYYRGDKTFQTLDKAAVGLSNVDNTSDANKSISDATQTALDGKEDDLPLTTRGDMLVRDAANATARLPVGADTQVLTSDGVDISWEDPTGGGAGGLTIEFVTGPTVVAVADTHYYCADTVTDITMPTIVGNEQVAVSPARGALWSADGITVTPAAGESIDGDAADETFILNLSGVSQVDFTGDLTNTNWEKGDTITPTTIGNGAYVGNWEAYTPSNTQGFGTITSRLQWRRVGETIEIVGDFTVGTVAASEVQIELPNSHTVNYSASSSSVVVGSLLRDANTTDGQTYNVLATDGDTYLNISWSTSALSTNATSPTTGTALVGSSERLTLFASVPVAEFANSGTTLTASDFSAKTKETALTVTGTNWTTNKATGISYRDSDGNYRLKANIVGSISSDATSFLGTIAGVTFDATDDQSMSVHLHDEGTGYRGPLLNVLDNNTSTFKVSASTQFNKIIVSFDALLASKPTWFDEHAENNFNLDVHFQEATSTKAGLVKKNKIITATTGDHSSTSLGNALFSGLTIGMLYKLELPFSSEIHEDANSRTIVNLKNNGVFVVGTDFERYGGTPTIAIKVGGSSYFTAAATTVTYDVTISGSSGRAYPADVKLTEIQDSEIVGSL